MIRLSIYQNGDNVLDGFTSWWDNIYEHLTQRNEPYTIDELDTLLAEWGARVARSVGNRGYVSFEDERKAALFLLRWS